MKRTMKQLVVQYHLYYTSHRHHRNAVFTLNQLVQNSYFKMRFLRYCSRRDAIDIVHIEVAVNCGVVTQTTIGLVKTHYRVHTTIQNAAASHKMNNCQLSTDD